MSRIILHVDMDAFYASIEQRDDPRLRGKPVIVGGTQRRGVVATASYEARPMGVRSAMPMVTALRLCPQAVVVKPRMRQYQRVSHEIMATLRNFTPVIEPLSLDEAFLDMTDGQNLFGPPDAMAQQVATAVFQKTGLSCSVGIGSNKFLAKLASDMDKPAGITWVPFDNPKSFIAPLPIRRLWGVGPRAASKLEHVGLKCIGDVAEADTELLNSLLGASLGQHVYRLAHAVDHREVQANRARKSVGSEQTLENNIQGHSAVRRHLRSHAEQVAATLRSKMLVAGGVRVKLRYADGFRLRSRQTTLRAPSDDSRSFFEAALELIKDLDVNEPIRLVGVAAFDLTPRDAGKQLGLFGPTEAEQQSELERTVDQIKARFGDKIDFGSG